MRLESILVRNSPWAIATRGAGQAAAARLPSGAEPVQRVVHGLCSQGRASQRRIKASPRPRPQGDSGRRERQWETALLVITSRHLVPSWVRFAFPGCQGGAGQGEPAPPGCCAVPSRFGAARPARRGREGRELLTEGLLGDALVWGERAGPCLLLTR